MNIALSTSVIQRGKTGVAQYVLALTRELMQHTHAVNFHLLVLEDDLPLFKELLIRVSKVGLDRIDAADRDRLLALSFKLIATRHRLGLIDEPLEARILIARRYFAEHLPKEMHGAVEFFDPENIGRIFDFEPFCIPRSAK